MFSKLIHHTFVSAVLAVPVLAAVAEGALAAQYLIIQNNNDLAIEQLYVSVSGSRTWGRDRLRGDVLEQEEDTTVSISGNRCDYNVKAIYEDGSYDYTTVNVCDEGNYIEFFGYGGENN